MTKSSETPPEHPSSDTHQSDQSDKNTQKTTSSSSFVGPEMSEWVRNALARFLPSDPSKEMGDVFSDLRHSLPTPCLALLGEPQVGKSSTVRVLTGDPNAHIGLGDGVPVTNRMEAYSYPPESELPLWTFLDTPGVGTVSPDEEAQSFAQLLQGAATVELEDGTTQPLPIPHMLIICVRADDEELAVLPWLSMWDKHETGRDLPLLVVQTCLHRVAYPHPTPYPFGPHGNELPEQVPEEAVSRLQAQRDAFLQQRPDARFVVVDLTDPEDEVGDPLYGADALFEAVMSMLPDAMVVMLRQQKEAFDEVFAHEGQRLVWHYSYMAAAAGALPPPIGDVGTLAVALTMLRQLAVQYRQEWEFRTVLDILWSLGSTTLLWIAARYFIRRIPIPILMAPVGAAGAFSLVMSLGQLMNWYYATVREGHQPTAEDVKGYWEQAQDETKEQWKSMVDTMWKQDQTK
jgi:uncharacterized protein (DUF697 family)